MALQEISHSIKNFFKSKNPVVYCLSGKWGVGKTYLFNEISKEYFPDKVNQANFHNITTPKNNLISVSLFGMSSIDDLKHKIIAEIILKNSEAKYISKTFKFIDVIAKKYFPFIDFDQKKILDSLIFNKYFIDFNYLF